MSHRFVIAIVACLCIFSSFLPAQKREEGNLIIDGIPEIPDRIKERMHQYQNVRSASFRDWNPNGDGMIISTRFGETSQIHFVAEPGAARQQLTFFPEPVSGGSFDPRDNREGFLFGMDAGGAENYQFYYFDLDEGQERLLTDGTSRNSGAVWSHSGEWIVFSSNLRNGRDFDLRLMQADRPGESEILLEVEGWWGAIDWSPDDRQLLVGHYVSVNESYLYIVDVASGEKTALNPDEDRKIAYGSAAWSHDGKYLYYSSDETGEFQKLMRYEVANGERTVLTLELAWDIDAIEVSPDGSKLAYVANVDGIGTLQILALPEMKPIALPALPIGMIYRLDFSASGSELALTLNTSQTPGDVYSIDFASNELKRWTMSEVGGLNTENFVSPELIRYPTFDQVDGKPRTIPAFYYRPENAAGKVPVIVSIHGGPESQARPWFSSLYQYWLNELGVAVLVPNVRGSSGYGKTYLTLDNDFLRENSVKDIGALLDWIERNPDLDHERVGVYGGSYGGYMVLATMTNYNERIRAGVDVVGISNFVTFLESTKEYRRDLRRVEYGDERDPEMRKFLLAISPTTNASKITKPLFVVQGANDPRVPLGEAEQIVKAVRDNGGTAWYLVATDEGHGFRKKSNRDYYLNAMSLFWEKHLLGNGSASD